VPYIPALKGEVTAPRITNLVPSLPLEGGNTPN
jgi:hypothetical protein